MGRWILRFRKKAAKKLSKLARDTQRKIFAYLDEKIATEKDPRRFGKPLQSQLYGLWRFRVEGYRIIVDIEDDELIVLVIDVDRRDKIYKRN